MDGVQYGGLPLEKIACYQYIHGPGGYVNGTRTVFSDSGTGKRKADTACSSFKPLTCGVPNRKSAFLRRVSQRGEGFRRTYNYYKIVASYRDKDGKPKHRLTQNLGVLSEEDAARLEMILQAQQDAELIVAKSSYVVVARRSTMVHGQFYLEER
jgi:hypothetical protein